MRTPSFHVTSPTRARYAKIARFAAATYNKRVVALEDEVSHFRLVGEVTAEIFVTNVVRKVTNKQTSHPGETANRARIASLFTTHGLFLVLRSSLNYLETT